MSKMQSMTMLRSTHYKIEAFRWRYKHDASGKLLVAELYPLWVDEFDNLVVTDGLNDSLDKQFKANTYTAAWYVGLTGGTPVFAAGDLMSSHAGWTEVTNYTQANRPTLTLGTVSAGSVNNSANKAAFTIDVGGATVGGAFIVTNNTKGGTTGILYGGGAFSGGNRVLLETDVLNVTITLNAAAS